jgi:archaemetzincin
VATPDGLRVVPIFCGDRSLLVEPLARELEERFHLRADVRTPSFDPELAFDSSRGQYHSRVLLGQLLREAAPAGAPDAPVRILGVANVDLFIPVLTFVFGEAQLGDRAAVVSAHRLDNRLYGLPPNPHLLFERLVKEAVHELGHTFGLLHCHDARCVMASSTYVEEIDLKGDRFCDRCLDRLREARSEAAGASGVALAGGG